MPLKLFSLILIIVASFGFILIPGFQVPPVYSQTPTDNAWNLMKVTGTNDLRICYQPTGTCTTALYIANATGNVGINTTSPGALLHILSGAAANAAGQEVLRLDASHSSAALGSGANINFYSSANFVGQIRTSTEASGQIGLAFSTYNSGLGERMRINAAGNVGIGTTAPAQKLHVSGNIRLSGEIISDSNPTLSTNTDICRETSTGRFGNCTSDRRLKENIHPLNLSALGIISKLKPSTFNFINSRQTQPGFIAQEVLEVVPEAVTKSTDGYYGLNDSTFTPFLVKAIQEQQEQIEQLKKEIADLKSTQND